MGIIVRNGNSYGGAPAIDSEENHLLIGDGSKWAKGSNFEVFNTPYSLGITGNLTDDQNMLVFTADGVDEEGESDTQATIAVGNKAGITVIGNSKAEVVSDSSLQVAANSKLAVTSNSSGNITGNSNLNMANNALTKFENNVRFSFVDQSVLDFGHAAMAHIYDNVYIDIDGTNDVNATTESHQYDHSHFVVNSRHMFFKNITIGEINPWNQKSHSTADGPTILIHDAPYITFDSGPLGSPVFQVSGYSHFSLTDTETTYTFNPHTESSEIFYRYNYKNNSLKSSPVTGKARASLGTPYSDGQDNVNPELMQGPIVHFNGSPTFDITRGSWTKITDQAALILEGETEIFATGQSYLELIDQSDVRFRSNAEVDIAQAQVKLDGGARIEVGTHTDVFGISNQIYLATPAGPIGIDNTKEDQTMIDMMKASCGAVGGPGFYCGDIAVNIKNSAEMGARLLIQGDNTMVSIGGQDKNGKGRWKDDVIPLVGVKIGGYGTNLIQIEGDTNSTSHIKISPDDGAALKTFIIPGPNSNTVLKQSTGEDGTFGLHLLGGKKSNTFIKMQANGGGKITYLLEGTDVFMQHENNVHVELWDDTKIIMRGHSEGATPWSDGKGQFGKTSSDSGPNHRGLDWSRPVSTTSDGPVSQMYDGSNFIMRGIWTYPEYDKAVTFTISKSYSSIEDLLDNGTVSDVDAFNDAIKKTIPNYEYLKGGTLSVTGTTATVTKFNYKPIGWEEHPEPQDDSPILELYERSEVRIGSAKIFADENGISINGVEFTNEQLAALKKLLS